MNWAVLLDRDGVINEDVSYLHQPEHLRLIPGSASAIQRLNQHQIPVIVITNQAGVARGYFPESQVAVLHAALSQQLAFDGAHIDRFYYCPHHPTEGIGAYRVDCTCRKPKPGMLLQAAREFNLELSRSFFVGDALSDMQAGEAAGCQNVLVQTGYGTRLWAEWPERMRPQHVAADLLGAVEWILKIEEMFP
jgi:D-glycero-D-manno-heptose 1,7-bisphosphate phosphatase